MSNQFSFKNEIIIGYAPYTKGKGFLNNLIRFDTAWVGINYFSMALAKLPYMAVGKNLAYTKKFFIQSMDLNHIMQYLQVMMTYLFKKLPKNQIIL